MAEFRAIRRHFASLAKAITDPLELSYELFAREIIEDVTMEEIDLPTHTVSKKNRLLLSAIMRNVEARPSLFHDFIDLLKDSGAHNLRELAEELETTYHEISAAESSGQSSTHAAPTDQSSTHPAPTVKHELSAENVTMTGLTHFEGKNKKMNIAEEIGMRYYVFGAILLNDRTGAIMSAIAHKCMGNPFDINMEILRRWIQGEGIENRSWQGLISVLRKSDLNALADYIEEVKGQ